ncbi:MAG: TlpA disulfide reductase family protein [Salegentibacter sp.]
MNKKLKKNLIEYGVIGAIALILYLTGLHTEVIGFMQRGILATGLMKPDVEQSAEAAKHNEDPAADYNLKMVNSKGELVSLEQFRGKVIFMNIWATWCPPCVAEMPGINKLYNQVKDEDIVFLMLSVDEKFQKAVDYSKKKGYDFEVYRPTGPLPPSYSSQSIPTTYVISADGKLVLTNMGMGDYNTREFKQFLGSLK